MFGHLYKYRLKSLLCMKEDIFWCLFFPIILCTCFFAAFSGISDKTNNFHSIPTAVVYEKENDKLIDELRRVAMESIAYCEDNGITDWASIKSRVKSGLSGYLFKKTRRSPMILPVISEI